MGLYQNRIVVKVGTYTVTNEIGRSVGTLFAGRGQ